MSALDPRSPIDDVQRVSREFDEVRRRLDLLESPSGTSAYRTVERLAATIEAIPITIAASDQKTAFGITNVYAEVAKVTFAVPAGKTKAAVSVILNGAVVDTTSGGAAIAYGRANFGNVLSQEFSAAKDAGASAVNNVINGAYTYNVDVNPGGNYAIRFEMRSGSATAFPAMPGNYALITIIATFTN